LDFTYLASSDFTFGKISFGEFAFVEFVFGEFDNRKFDSDFPRTTHYMDTDFYLSSIAEILFVRSVRCKYSGSEYPASSEIRVICTNRNRSNTQV